MNVRILYFASLRETVGQASETLDLPPGVATVGDLRKYLAARGDAWSGAFAQDRPLASVNQQMAGDEQTLASGDEVAFFPPVTGG